MDKKNLSPFVRGIIRALANVVLMGLVVFVSAGRMNYYRGFVYLVLTAIVAVATLYSTKNNPNLQEERLNPGEGEKPFDKIYWKLSAPLYFIILLLAGLDAGRFQWSSGLPPVLYVFSVCVFLLGNALFIWAKSVNNFFSSVVRIQKDRGHKVCDQGPYKVIRHPGYLGVVLTNLSLPLVLGSYWACIPAVLFLVLTMIRTALEDKTLAEELAGYKKYQAKVKYKVIPLIW